jgi:hypothetical protein
MHEEEAEESEWEYEYDTNEFEVTISKSVFYCITEPTKHRNIILS